MGKLNGVVGWITCDADDPDVDPVPDAGAGNWKLFTSNGWGGTMGYASNTGRSRGESLNVRNSVGLSSDVPDVPEAPDALGPAERNGLSNSICACRTSLFTARCNPASSSALSSVDGEALRLPRVVVDPGLRRSSTSTSSILAHGRKSDDGRGGTYPSGNP